MRELARLTLQGRRGQIAALAATVLFSAILIGALGLLFETGARGQVSTGEYAKAPVLLGAPQSLSVSGDVDVAVPGRALLPDDLVTLIARAMPSSRVVADHIVPADLADSAHNQFSVSAHPWSAFALGDRNLASGRPPKAAGEIVLPRRSASTNGAELGDKVRVAFGGQPRELTVVGLADADDAGADVPDVYLSDRTLTTYERLGNGVAAIGVWPRGGDDTNALYRLAKRHGARQWPRGERGGIEVVRQGQAKATLTSAAGAFGGVAFIVAMFMVMALTSLQIRERSRELAMLRVIGATPKQIKRLVLSEVRRVALIAGAVGGILGPFLGAVVVAVGRSSDVLPRGLNPVFGVLPFIVPVLAGLVAAELAVRISVRRVVGRGSPLAGLRGSEQIAARSRRAPRVLAGSLVLVGGLGMSGAPWYVEGEAGIALAGLSPLVIAVSIALLSPLVVTAVAGTLRGPAERSAARYLALSSLRMRAIRVGGALAPIVLGVTLTCTQVFTTATTGAVIGDEIRAGQRADLVVASSPAGIDEDTVKAIREITGVVSVDPIAASTVVVRSHSKDSTWQSLPALGADGSGLARYADLAPRPGGSLDLGRDEVALGRQGSDTVHAKVGDPVDVVLADGRMLHRRVSAIFRRDLGFGEVVLPLDDLQPAMASGLPSALALTVTDHTTLAQVEARIDERLGSHLALEVHRFAPVQDASIARDETTFQTFLLLIVWGYIAIAVVNSLVLATLARRSELALLHAVGATPSQRRRVRRWEALFLAAAGCAVGTLAALPGLAGVTYSLSNGERFVPAIAPGPYLLVVVLTFALVLATSALSGRSAMRKT